MKYEYVLNDFKIIDIYNQIRSLEDNNTCYLHHDLTHAKNVAIMMRKILSDLKLDMTFIDEAMIAAILHDTGYIKGENGYSFNSYNYALNYFQMYNMRLQYGNFVLDAIKNCGTIIDTNNLMTLTLRLCDYLDITNNRVGRTGTSCPGIRQFLRINSIDIDIVDNNFTINFMCDNDIDMVELGDCEYIKNAFRAIDFYTSKLNMIPKIKLNNVVWFVNH